MNRRQTGFGLIGLGSVVAFVGLALLVTSGSEPSGAAVATVTTAPAPQTTPPVTATTTTSSPATTTPPPTTGTTPPTTSTPTTSVAPSTTVAPTTTTADQAALVEAFIADFAAATASDDLDFLVARLHPLSVEASDEATCAAFVASEITALEDYRATGPVQQTAFQVTIDGQAFAVDLAFEVPVEFTFSGQTFPDDARFALVDGIVHYFATCR